MLGQLDRSCISRILAATDITLPKRIKVLLATVFVERPLMCEEVLNTHPVSWLTIVIAICDANVVQIAARTEA